MKLGTSILWQINVPALYNHLAVLAGKKPFDQGFVNRDTALLRTSVAFGILFYSTLWLVKLSFLMFFRRLGSKVIGLSIWWWCILVVTVLTWVACVADIQYKCSLSSYAFIICEFSPTCLGTNLSMNAGRRSRWRTGWWKAHCGSLESRHYLNRTFYANCVADVMTDCLSKSGPP